MTTANWRFDMKWMGASKDTRDVQREWNKLRGRACNTSGFRTTKYPLDRHVDWKQLPSNQFASAESMKDAGWAMCQCRDAEGRLR